MLFAVDVGNSHTVAGLFASADLIYHWQLKSDQDRTADELAIRYHGLFQMDAIDRHRITGFILASVVPALTGQWLAFAEKYLPGLTSTPLCVDHTTDTGIEVATANPTEVGPDRLVNAAAAWARFSQSCLVIDFGTAITFDCIDDKKRYLGGTIVPGIGISLDALASRTARLPRITLEQHQSQVIGKTTESAIRAGMLYGFGGLTDHLIKLLTKELASNICQIPTIATGGMAAIIAPYAHRIDQVDPWLTLKGLHLIYRRNCHVC